MGLNGFAPIFIMNTCKFIHDNNTEINLLDHKYSFTFAQRPVHEKQFRRINSFLINNGIIKNNIIDAGCWMGDNAVPWAKMITGIVYAIDPSEDHLDYINKTCAINQINNIVTINGVLSDNQKIVSTNEDLYHCSFISSDAAKIKLVSTSIDILYQTKTIDNIGYIHLDVEGMEQSAINGSENVINTFRPIITFEQHLNTDKYVDLCNHLQNMSYVTFMINELLPGCREDCRNFIAFPIDGFNSSLISAISSDIDQKDILITVN